MTYTIFILYQALPAWLALSRAERNQLVAAQVNPLFERYKADLRVRLFDAEAFHARVSDVLMVECNDLKTYYHFMEHLRDTDLFARPYIELRDVVVSLENGFRDVDAANLPDA